MEKAAMRVIYVLLIAILSVVLVRLIWSFKTDLVIKDTYESFAEEPLLEPIQDDTPPLLAEESLSKPIQDNTSLIQNNVPPIQDSALSEPTQDNTSPLLEEPVINADDNATKDEPIKDIDELPNEMQPVEIQLLDPSILLSNDDRVYTIEEAKMMLSWVNKDIDSFVCHDNGVYKDYYYYTMYMGDEEYRYSIIACRKLSDPKDKSNNIALYYIGHTEQIFTLAVITTQQDTHNVYYLLDNIVYIESTSALSQDELLETLKDTILFCEAIAYDSIIYDKILNDDC